MLFSAMVVQSRFMSTPASLHPDLADDRMAIVAELLREARDSSVDDHRPAKGERNWSLGTRGLERGMHALQEAALVYPWLKILNSSRHFRFMIGAVPVAFYHGRARKPKASTLRRRADELRQTSLAFPGVPTPPAIRIAVETDETGKVSTILVAQVEASAGGGGPWEIWPRASVSGVFTPAPMRAKPAALPRPKLGLKRKPAAAKPAKSA